MERTTSASVMTPLEERGADAHIPPREDAPILGEGGGRPMPAKNQTLNRIEEVGRAEWKRESGYHRPLSG